jgi:D-alanyl-D-alanine carboxypeptidase/D-alanyl-D-alanine-endopeptidase (penicillin-binding protein 4)
VPASCLLADGPTGAVVSLGVDRPLAAASVQKLLVGAAALSALGPDFRFRTLAVSAAPPVNGTVDRVWLVGAGDPVLATPAFAGQLSTRPRYGSLPLTPLDELAARVAGAGVHTITNGVTPDDSRYSRERTLSVWTKAQEPEKNVGALGALVVDGGWKPGSKPWVTDPGDPSVTAANAFTQLLSAHDVGAPAANGQGGAPTTAFTVAAIDSAPLASIVAAMLRTSDNFTAEELVRELGARFGGAGTHDAGLAVIRDQLTKLGVPLDGVTLVDGSGMSFSDRATCRAVATALALADQATFHGLADGLAVPGAPGTLSKRYVGTPLAARLRAKTGSITHVQALAGTLAAGVPLRFVLLQNAVASATAASVERNVLDVLLTAS